MQYANQQGTDIPLVYAFREFLTHSDVKNRVNQNKFLAGICHPISTLNTDLVAFLHERNRLIVTYTCNTQEEIQKALDLEVDILITDNPAKALRLRG